MKKTIQALTIIALLCATRAESARFIPSPEVPGVTCADGIDNDADGQVDASDADCAASSPFSANGNGYRANVKDGLLAGWTTAADATASSGSYAKKTDQSAAFFDGELALHNNFTNASYYAWIRYRCSETTCAAWFDTAPIKFDINNATQAMILTNQSSFAWAQVLVTGSNTNFASFLNGGGVRTFALNGDGAIFIKSTSGLEIDCVDLDPDADHMPDCPATGASQPTANYEILELGGNSAPTDWDSAAFDNANILQFSGNDTTSSLTCTVKIIWDNNTTDRGYISADCNDTDAQIASTANDTFSTQEDDVDFRWRGDLSQVFDTGMKMVTGNLQPIYTDADWSGVGDTRDFATSLNTTVVKTVAAGSSWKIFLAFDLGSNITPDDLGICNLVIRDKDAGLSATQKHFFGTTGSALTNAAEFGICKFSSTALPGSPDSTDPVVTNTTEANITTSAATIAFDTDEAGTAAITYGTSTGSYPLTSASQQVTTSGAIALTGLSSSTQYFYKARVCDAAGNCGLSAEDSFTTSSASTADLFASSTGSGTACSSGSPCSPETLLNQIVAGQIGEFAGGTYQGSSKHIAPPSGKNGTSTNKITIRCATDGGCLIDGQGLRQPIRLSDNDWWVIEGFNAANSNADVVNLATGADNNTIRRICAWNANPDANARVFGVSGSSNTLEDVCGFGTGRRIIGLTQGGDNTIVRRAWVIWEQQNLVTGPQTPIQCCYNSSRNLFENVISTSDWTGAGSSNFNGGAIGFHIGSTPIGHRVLGSVFYALSGENVAQGILVRTDWDPGVDVQVMMKDVVAYTEQAKTPFNLASQNCTACFLTNTTEIGGNASSIGGAWIQTNRVDVDTVGAAPNIWNGAGTSGARVCKRYVNGNLTNDPLWPWPMDARIRAALTAAGKDPDAIFGGVGNGVTELMESIFGTIPAACKS